MSGTPLSEFTTFAASQGPAWASGAEQLINDAHRNTFLFSRWASGKDVKMDMLQGGADIRDTIFLDYVSTFQRVNPNVELTAPNPQTGTTWNIPWAIATATMGWTEPEIDLNAGNMSGKYRSQVYKKVLYQKHQNLWTEVTEALDNEIIRNVPNTTTMESDTPGGPRAVYGLHCFVNEYNTSTTPYATGASPAAPLIGGLNGAGLIPSGIDASGTAWTTVQNIDPTAAGQENWRPYQGTYGTWQNGSASIDKNVAMSELFVAMSKAQRATGIMAMPKHSEYSDPYTSPNVIYTGSEGIAYYEQALRGNQDQFRGVGKTSGQDPDYDGPKFGRTPIQHVQAMDFIELYATSTASGGGSGVTELDATAAHVGPRFIGCNGKYIKPVVHENKYCVMTAPEQPSGQPLSWVQYMKLYNNNYCQSRRRHWHLRPDQSAAA